MRIVLKALFIISLLVSFSLVSVLSFAGEVDILVKKLVEKGVLTHGEAQQILTETKEEVRREIAEGSSASLPSWLQNIKLSGDLRVRYQWDEKQGTNPVSGQDQHRGRIRFRLGTEAKVNNKLKVLAGLATGGSDPRSTNETLDNSFETPDIRLDYAMAEWYAASWATLKAGKLNGVSKQLMVTTDMLWDTDINPEGLSLQFSKDFAAIENLNLFFNTGLWVLDEYSNNTDDPFMYYFQPGFKYSFLENNLKLKMACAAYFFDNVQGKTLDHSAGSNSTTGTPAGLMYDYNSVSPSMELGINKPLVLSKIPGVDYAAVFAEGVHNPSPKDDHSGWSAGIKLGAEKIQDWGQWQLKYIYKRLEKDSWLDAFPDSDAHGGRTDIKGHEVILEYGLGKNTSIGIDWYEIDRIKSSTSDRANVFQIDWMMKF